MFTTISSVGFNEVSYMTDNILKLLRSELKVINIGLEIFKDALENQGVSVAQVSWQKPPSLEKEYEDILSKIL
jgi:hypothetical protein